MQHMVLFGTCPYLPLEVCPCDTCEVHVVDTLTHGEYSNIWWSQGEHSNIW